MILQSEKKNMFVFLCVFVLDLICGACPLHHFFSRQSLPHLINQPASFKMYRSVKRSLVLQTPMT